MKKKWFFALVVLLCGLSSCTETLKGDYGVVVGVSSTKGKEYQYSVRVNHSNVNSFNGVYRLQTNTPYQVGDTIWLTKKN